jgi:hypothetical protein
MPVPDDWTPPASGSAVLWDIPASFWLAFAASDTNVADDTGMPVIVDMTGTKGQQRAAAAAAAATAPQGDESDSDSCDSDGAEDGGGAKSTEIR